MELLKELSGFVVLTGPLFLIIIWLPVSIWAATKISKRYTRGSLKRKFSIGLLLFVAIFLAPFADEIAGRIYLNHLCATEAGVKVYQTVELPAEYWDEQGRAKIFNKYGYLNHEFWVKELDESGSHVERYSSVIYIDRDISPVKERASQKVLAEITTFRFMGGWIRRNLSPNNTSNSCKFIDDSNFSRSFYGRLFEPEHISN